MMTRHSFSGDLGAKGVIKKNGYYGHTNHPTTRIDFGSKNMFMKEWLMPGYDFNDEIGEKRFGLGVDAVTKEKYAWFMDTQIIPIRTKRAFQAPFTIVSDIIRENKCSNHFIMTVPISR